MRDSLPRELEAELDRFDERLPIERASTPPASWYLVPEFLELERRALLSESWQPVARVGELEADGAFRASDLLGEPFFVVRDGSALRAFHNVCSHHATRLLEGDGRCDQIVCPYHGWTFARDGRLLRAAGAGGIEGFDRAAFALREVRLATAGDLVMICLGDSPPDLETQLAPIGCDLFEGLVFAAERSYRVRANWKVVVDNYLDGGYHVAQLHRGLAQSLDLASYRTELYDAAVVQSVVADAAVGDARVGAGALYVWIHPTLMLNRYGPVLDVNRVVPRGVAETDVIFDFYFEPGTAPDFIAESLAASERVQDEDTAVCERVQDGLRSRAYDRGRYAPRFEGGAYLFHRLVKASLSGGERRG